MNERSEGIRLCNSQEIGMLQIKGPGLASGYVNPMHDAGARTEDGWLITGDLGRVDEDGYVFVTGRAKDVIIRGGHNIDPALIEEPLLELPAVLHAAAVGKPDSNAGEIPVAYVQLVPGARATAADLIAAVKGRIAERAAIPKEIFVVDTLPLTDVGKPIKAALRRDAAERAFRSALSEATGIACESGQLEIAVRLDPTRGQVVAIAVYGVAVAEQREKAALISDVMNRYTFAYAVEWK